MNFQALDPLLVLVLLLNFFILGTTRLGAVIYAVAWQGVLLGVIYPAAHGGLRPGGLLPGPGAGADLAGQAVEVHVLVLACVMIALKGIIIPRLLFRAVREADIKWQVESSIGVLPTLFIGVAGTGLAMAFATTLPLAAGHTSTLVVPSALATVLAGFLLLTTRYKAITQVLGYVVLENGIFIFGLLLIEALPFLVEVGVLLDLFVGVFVMGIIINHVSRAFPSTSTDQLSALQE